MIRAMLLAVLSGRPLFAGRGSTDPHVGPGFLERARKRDNERAVGGAGEEGAEFLTRSS